MRYRLLGNSGLRISQLILGGMTFGDADEAECRRMVDLYADAGGNTIDTAVNYHEGASESIIGNLLKGRRDRFVLSTKYTVSRDRTDPNAAGNHRKNLRASLETSLRRLGTDYIDLYWVHIWDRLTPVEETMRALDDAVRSGKVLYLGISDAPAWIVARANTIANWRGLTGFDAIQLPYNLIQRDAERELLPMAQELGLSVGAWSPLAGGLLTGKYRRASEGRLSSESFTERERDIVETVCEVAGEVGATATQIAIAWLVSRSPNVLPILGARTTEQLRESLPSLRIGLTGEQLGRLQDASRFDVGFPTDFLIRTAPRVLGETVIHSSRPKHR